MGLLVDTTSVHLASVGGLTLVDPAAGRTLEVGGTSEVTVAAAPGGGLSVLAGGGAVVVPGDALLVRPENGVVAIGGRPYRGIAVVRRTGEGRVTAINQVDMEAYLLGVVPREIGNVGEELLQAAKAQAVAARTYAVRYLGRREALGFDVFATVEDQVYGGVEAEHAPVSRAVRETAGEILTHDGEPIEAFYHSTCAGRTAAIEEVWNEAPRPYLVSVVDVDPGTGLAYDSTSSRFRWSVAWPADSLARILAGTLADSLPPGVDSVGEIVDVQVLERTPSGRVRDLRITTSTATFHVGGDRVRWIFLTPAGAVLNSSRFDVRLVRDADGAVREVVAEGGGWGHGIGMCQVGAMGRARAGQDYRTILEAYYPGSRLADLY